MASTHLLAHGGRVSSVHERYTARTAARWIFGEFGRRNVGVRAALMSA